MNWKLLESEENQIVPLQVWCQRIAGHFHKIALVLFVTLCYGGNSFKGCIVQDNPDQDHLSEITWIAVHKGIGVWA